MKTELVRLLCLMFAITPLSVAAAAKARLADNPTPVVTVSAASYEATAIAPEAIVAAFGTQLATSTAVGGDTDPGTPGVQLPTTLAGTTVEVAGRAAGLFFVSPNQINYVIPAATPAGLATVVVRAGDGTVSNGTVQVSTVAPSIFTANSDGGGVPAANLVRVRANGQQTGESPADYDATANRYITRPIDLGPNGETVVLVLYVTGIRYAPDPNGDGNANENVRVSIGGSEVVPQYAGRQPGYVGLDQINVEIPRSLIGRGKVNLSITGSGVASSNQAQLEIAALPGNAPPVVSGFSSSSVLAGQSLNITGSGFSTNATDNLIRIGGVEARLVSATSTQLSVIVPFGAETGAATVRTPQGEGKSSSSLPVRTSVSGFVETTSRQPMSGATVRINGTNISAQSGADGLFVLPDVPGGAALVEIDGTSVPTSPPYPKVTLKMSVSANRDNPFSRPVALQQASGATIPVGSGSVTQPGITEVTAVDEGSIQSGNVTFEVPDNATALFPDGARSGLLTLTVVANSRTPVNLPPGAFSSAIVQITPFGVKLNPGGKLTFPNPDGFPAGTTATLYRYDVNAGGFVQSGNATVSSDGQSIATAANAITETSYFFVSIARPTTTVIGRVVDSDGTTPVRNAVVRAKGQESFTDGNGGFIMRNVQVGSDNQITVEASLARASGRIDRVQRTGIPVVVNGTTTVTPDLVLTAETVNRPPVLLAPASTTLNVAQTRNLSIRVSDPDPGQTVNLTATGVPFLNLSNQGSGAYTLQLTPNSAQAGTYTVVLTATDNLGASVSQNVAVTVTSYPDLALTMTESPDPITIGAGQNLTYSISVSNNGVVPATGVAVSDTLPAGVNFVSANASVGSCANNSGTVTCTIGNLAVNASASVTIVVAPTAAATLNNTATVTSATTDFNPVNNSATTVTTVNVANADLEVALSSSPSNPVTVGSGQNISYSMTVYNNGPTSTATGVVLTDTLPTGTTFVSATPTSGNCSVSSGVVTCNLGNIPSSAGVTIVVTPTTAGKLTNSISVTGTLPDNNPANNTASISNSVNAASADLSLAMNSSPVAVTLTAGQNISYSISVTNNGPSVASGITVTDTLPSGVTFVSASSAGGNCTLSNGTVTCNLNNLNSGSGHNVSIVVTPTTAGTVTNSASVSSSSTDNNSSNNSASVSNTINSANADLVLTMSSAPNPVTLGAGQNITYSISVVSNGPSTASGLTVTDTLPAGVTYVSSSVSSGTCSFAAGVVTCTLSSLNAGSGWNISIVVTPTIAGSITSSASIASVSTDANSANNSASVINTVNASNADLAVTISDSPDPRILGQGNVNYSISVTNNGPSATATGVVVTDTLPANLTFVSASSSLGSCTFAGGTVTCNIGNLTGSTNVTIVVAPTAAGNYSNTVSVSGTLPDNNSANNSATAVTSVNSNTTDPASADVDLTMSATGQVTLGSGSNINYSMTVRNFGPAATAASVTLTDRLPTGLNFVSASTSSGTCAFSNGTVTCNLGNIASSASVTIVTTPTTAGVITNTVNVTAATNDLVASNNAQTVSTNVLASNTDLQVYNMTANATVTLGAGQNITYNIPIYNNGPATTATGVVVTDTLPAGVTFVSAAASQGTCNLANGTVTCNLGSLTSNANVSIVVTPTIAGVITNTASVSGTLPDNLPSNNALTVTTNVLPTNANLEVYSMSANATVTLGAGQNITYNIPVYNNGPATTATGVVVTDTLPAGVTFVSAAASQGTCNLANGTVTCNLGSLGIGPANVSIVVTPTVAGVITNTASISGTLPDLVPGNNAQTVSTSVLPTNADMQVYSMSATAKVTLGQNQNITYNIPVYNNGPATASGVVVTDTLPAGVSFVSANATQGTCSFAGGTVTCNLGAMSPGGAQVTIVVAPTAAGIISNTASISSALPDNNQANNSQTVATNVSSITADLSLTMSATGQVTLGTNQNITYTMTLSNRGPAASVSGVVVTDVLPAGVSFVSASTSQGACSAASGTVTCNIGTVSGNVNLSIVVAPTFSGAITNTATVTGSLADSVPGNNSASASTNVLPALIPPPDGQATESGGSKKP
ncbi:MAG: IPT/TIG domain-containing protein [Blastocatellia bacterium]